ncbi:MAG: hemerythrin domain-containing protein [Pseudonocardiales bacterium]|nr:hemerythrin domain-containing protein [Pseudonocardiales bacterium]
MPEHHADDDVIAELIVDHREVEAMLTSLQGELSAEARQDTMEHVIAELVRHAIAEESYLYPAIEDRVPNGKAIADKERADHLEVEQLLKQLEGEDPHAPESRPTLMRLVTSLHEHIADEEGNLFPALRQVYSEQELKDLGDKVRTAKKAAPTRPHPSAPRGELARKTMGPMVGLVDRTRDLLTGRKV